MKDFLYKIIFGVLLAFMQTTLYAQSESGNPEQDTIIAEVKQPVNTTLPYSTISPYDIRVTYDKTTHIIFPAAIRYVDLGSENIVAGKAEDAQNVLRVKAAVRGFSEETNFSVITDEGRFYNFNVRFSEYPETLTIDFLREANTAQENTSVQNTQDVALLKELGNDPPYVAQVMMEAIYAQNKRFIRHIGAESFGIQVLLKGIYTQNGKLNFHIQINNSTNIPFVIDFISFKIVDKKVAKRTVIQERIIHPLREYLKLEQVAGNTTERNIYLLDQITIPDDKLLLIEIFEKNGGRHQTLKIENSDLVRARLIKKLHLKL